MSSTTRQWIGGIISALSGAIGTALSTMIVDPKDFNLYEGWPKVAWCSGISAAIALFNYLKQSPLPGWGTE